MQIPKKAVIGLSGASSRFIPATKVLPKQMMPIIDKPIVQYGVEELVATGVKDIILVTNSDGQTIEDHFDSNLSLEQTLIDQGKVDKMKAIRELAEMANFINIRQKHFMPYGPGVPLLISIDLVNDGPFFFLYGDDVCLSDTPVCQQLFDVFQKNPDAAAVVAAQRMPEDQLHKYGVFKIKEGTNNEVETLTEKPDPGTAPSDLISIGRFLFTPKIESIIKNLRTGKNNELWLADAIKELAQKEKVIVHEIEGQWFTTGDPLNFLKANIEFALNRSDFKEEFSTFLKEKAKEI